MSEINDDVLRNIQIYYATLIAIFLGMELFTGHKEYIHIYLTYLFSRCKKFGASTWGWFALEGLMILTIMFIIAGYIATFFDIIFTINDVNDENDAKEIKLKSLKISLSLFFLSLFYGLYKFSKIYKPKDGNEIKDFEDFAKRYSILAFIVTQLGIYCGLLAETLKIKT